MYILSILYISISEELPNDVYTFVILSFFFYMPRGRGVRRARQQHPYGVVGRGQAVRRRNPGRAAAVRQEPEVQREPAVSPEPVVQQEEVPAPIHTATIGIQADNTVINGEDFTIDSTPVSYNINNDPLIVPMNNDIDLFVSQNVKEKIWGLQYVNLALLLQQNFDIPNETTKSNCLTVVNGNVVVNTDNKHLKIKNIENINTWTDAFINFSKIVIQRHPLLAMDLLSYMSLIRSLASDAPFVRIYQYDQQFRLRVAQNPSKSWSQIDGNLWFRFIAKGALGGQLVTSNQFQTLQSQQLQRCCYDFNFKKGCSRVNCTYRHVCLKCFGFHPSVLCTSNKNVQNSQYLNPRLSGPRSKIPVHRNQISPFVQQPPRLNFKPPAFYPQNIRY